MMYSVVFFNDIDFIESGRYSVYNFEEIWKRI